MNKRLFTICITCVTVILSAAFATGCGSGNSDPNSADSITPVPSDFNSLEASYNIEASENNPGISEDNPGVSEDNPGISEVAGTEETESEKFYFLGSRDIYCMDESGNASSVFKFPENEYARDVCSLGSEVYAVGYEFGNDSEGVTASYIHYLNTGDPSKNTDVRVPDKYNRLIDFIGIYDGKLYFNYNDNMNVRKPGTFDGKEIVFGTDNELYEYENKLKEEGLETIVYGLDAVSSLVKFGEIFRKREGTDVIVRIDSDGQKHDMNTSQFEPQRFTDFYGDYAIASSYEYDENYNLVDGEVYLYDLTNNSARVIDYFNESTINTFLGYEDGYLYFRRQVERLSEPDYDYYRMDIDKSTSDAVKICRKTYDLFEHLPELSKEACFNQYVIGKNVFLYQKMNGNMLEWFKVYPDGRQSGTGAYVCEVESSKYGTAKHDAHHYYDREHEDGLEYYEYSIDRFTPNEEVSENSIWTRLKLEELYAEFEADCRKSEEDNRLMLEDESFLQTLRQTGGNAEDAMDFEGARLINDKYFQVTFGYRMYFAHALNGEYIRKFYLFDTQTGKEIGIEDIYPGTLDEFKKLVADYTLEYWKNSDEGVFSTPYNEEEDDEMYKDFCDKAGFDMDIDFGDEEFTVYYVPYEYTTVDAGLLGITIPYRR